jgi:hypothetical protein
MSGQIRSQWAFKVSPDGARLGYLTPDSGALHVRSRDGHESTLAGVKSNDWRFAHDGTHVAAIIGEGFERAIVVLDVTSGTTRELGRSQIADHLEWTKQGVVVRELRQLDRRGLSNRYRLTYYPLAGPSRTLVERKGIRQFATASNGSRVIFFDTARDGWAEIFDLSVDGTENPRMLGKLRHVMDAEVASEGDRAAVVTDTGVFLMERGKPRRVSREKKVATLWFSTDGARVMFASPKLVTLVVGKETRTLAARGQRFESARFLGGGHAVLIAGEHSVLRWNADQDEPATVVTSRDGEKLLAADILGHDVVVWAQQPIATP